MLLRTLGIESVVLGPLCRPLFSSPRSHIDGDGYHPLRPCGNSSQATFDCALRGLQEARHRLGDVAPHLSDLDHVQPPMWLNGQYFKVYSTLFVVSSQAYVKSKSLLFPSVVYTWVFSKESNINEPIAACGLTVVDPIHCILPCNC